MSFLAGVFINVYIFNLYLNEKRKNKTHNCACYKFDRRLLEKYGCQFRGKKE
jgi:hypothetical protein